MARRLTTNLRRGHRAEGMGVQLLRGLFAVAQVPQEEDIGIDAICTLLRSEGRFLIPELSAYVQVKAASERRVVFDADDYQWVRKLELPYFIASVNLDTHSVELYSGHNAISRVDARGYTGCVMSLDEIPSKITGEVVEQWLGEPALKWSMADCDSKDKRQVLYQVMKSWLVEEGRNIKTREVNAIRCLHWQTNEPPRFANTGIMGHREDLRKDCEAAQPYLLKILSHLIFEPDSDDIGALYGLHLLAAWMKEKAPDAAMGIVPSLPLALLRHAAKKAEPNQE